MTKPEKEVIAILKELGITVNPYSQNKTDNGLYSQVPFEKQRLDFASPARKIAIEVNGDYWHASRITNLTASQLKRRLDDMFKAWKLRQNGWKLFQITASDLFNEDRRKKVKNYLMQLLTSELDLL